MLLTQLNQPSSHPPNINIIHRKAPQACLFLYQPYSISHPASLPSVHPMVQEEQNSGCQEFALAGKGNPPGQPAYSLTVRRVLYSGVSYNAGFIRLRINAALFSLYVLIVDQIWRSGGYR